MSKCNSLATSFEKSLETDYSEKTGITEVGGISIPNRMDQNQKEENNDEIKSVKEIKPEKSHLSSSEKDFKEYHGHGSTDGITEVEGISTPNRINQIQKELANNAATKSNEFVQMKRKNRKVKPKRTMKAEDVASVTEINAEAATEPEAGNKASDDQHEGSSQNVKGKSDENPDDENISERTEAMEKWVANEFVLISKRKKMSKGSTEKEKWRAAANERQRTFMEQWL
jgi:hypothetical protein